MVEAQTAVVAIADAVMNGELSTAEPNGELTELRRAQAEERTGELTGEQTGDSAGELTGELTGEPAEEH